nr:VTT domain-containing protein [Feifania hominis]
MQAYGGKGIPIIVALQALQVITTVFPAVAVQVLAGLSYGIVLGTILCCIGYLVGNAIVFIIIRQFHKAFAPFLKRERAVEERTEKKRKWNLAFLSETKNIERVTFLLFLIPGLPNGFLPYIFARTKVPLFNYLRSIALASIPAIAVCTLAGQRFSRGDSKTGLIVLGVILALAVVVFFSRDRVMKFVERESKTEPKRRESGK